MAYKIKIEPVSNGAIISSASRIKKGALKQEGIVHEIVIDPTSAQIMGVMNYLACIEAGDTTTSVESAITALTP